MLLSKGAICGNQKLGFIKQQEAKGTLSSLDLKRSLRTILLLGDILF